MVKEIKKRIEKRKAKIIAACIGMQAFMMSTAAVSADENAISSSADEAATQATGFLQSFARPATLIILAAGGLILYIGTRRQKDGFKDGIFERVIGLGILIFAIPFSDLILSWFSAGGQ